MRSLLLPLALLTAAPTFAQPLAISPPRPEQLGSFAFSVAGLPDADGDGGGDFLIGVYKEDARVGGTTYEDVGRVYLHSGTTGARLRALRSPNAEEGGGFGYDVAGVPDADGDGKGDLLVGAPFEDSGTSPLDEGRAYVFSGATGALLHTLQSPNPVPSGNFGWSVSGVPDADGDSRGDLLVASPPFGGEQRAHLYSGATGALLRTLDVRPYDVSGVPDADGDGRGDLLVGGCIPGCSRRQANLYSGATGVLLHSLVTPNPNPTGDFGDAVAGVPDADGDGKGDLLVGADEEVFFGGRLGKAYLFSGATGALLHTLEPLVGIITPGGFGEAVTGIPDLDGDGHGDLAVGAPSDFISGSNGLVYVYSGATGHLLFFLATPDDTQVDAGFGESVAGMPDADGDGRGDGVVGAPNEDLDAAFSAGRAYLYRTDGRFDGRWVADNATAASEAEAAEIPAALAFAASPNPFTSATTLRVSLPRSAEVAVEVLDVLGRRVAFVHQGALAGGTHDVRWAPAAGLPGGVYLLRLRVEGEPARVQRVTLAR